MIFYATTSVTVTVDIRLYHIQPADNLPGMNVKLM
jgi:hypothetical protein